MRILLLGDSHTVGAYGTALEQLLRSGGHDVTRVGIVGAAAYHYNTGKHRDLKGKWVQRVGNFDEAKGKDYDLAVVSLGTNDVTGWSVNAAATDISKLIGSLKATTKVWVGAPSFSANAARTYNPDFAKRDLNTRADDLWQTLSVNYGPLALDPRRATAPYVQERDIHFKADGGQAWAQFVAAALPLSTASASASAPASTGAPAQSPSATFAPSPSGAFGGKLPILLVAAGAVVALALIMRSGERANV